MSVAKVPSVMELTRKPGKQLTPSSADQTDFEVA